MKPLIRLFLLVVCSTFGVCIGLLAGISFGLGLSEDGLALLSVDYDRPSIRYDSITLGKDKDGLPVTLHDIPQGRATDEFVREYLNSRRPSDLSDEDFETDVEIASVLAERQYSHQIYANSFWVLTIASAFIGLTAAFFSGRWLWRFLYAEGD